MDDIHLTGAAIGRLTQGIGEEQGGRVADDLMAERDALILAMLKTARPLR